MDELPDKRTFIAQELHGEKDGLLSYYTVIL
jgi:hypothetical protein